MYRGVLIKNPIVQNEMILTFEELSSLETEKISYEARPLSFHGPHIISVMNNRLFKGYLKVVVSQKKKKN